MSVTPQYIRKKDQGFKIQEFLSERSIHCWPFCPPPVRNLRCWESAAQTKHGNIPLDTPGLNKGSQKLTYTLILPFSALYISIRCFCVTAASDLVGTPETNTSDSGKFCLTAKKSSTVSEASSKQREREKLVCTGKRLSFLLHFFSLRFLEKSDWSSRGNSRGPLRLNRRKYIWK